MDAATVLRELRGELSPFRERIVRKVFHEIFGLSGNKTNDGSMGGDGAGRGGWCSSVGLGPGGGEGRRNPSTACLDAEVHKSAAAGRRIPSQGVSIEQCLEYYKWVGRGRLVQAFT